MQSNSTNETNKNARTLILVVETYFNNSCEGLRHINHNSREDRVWLGKHCFWAFRNGRAIVTYPASETFKFRCD